MRKRLSGNSLSDTVSVADDGARINASDFAHTLCSFAKEHLTGALTVEVRGECEGILSVSPRLAAYALKEMLSYARADEVAHLVITLTDPVNMELIFESVPKAEDLARILSFCRHVGFEVARSEKSVILRAESKRAEIMSIYALTTNDFIEELENIFICK